MPNGRSVSWRSTFAATRRGTPKSSSAGTTRASRTGSTRPCPAFDAFRRACADTLGCAPFEVGSGGSLPLAAALAEAYPDMALLLTGVDDPESKAHSENESVHLGELKQRCVSEALLLGYLAAQIS